MTKLAPFLTVAAAGSFLAASAVVDYPTGYRAWQHVKSMVIQPDHPLSDPFEGLHHVYANEAAMAGLKSGTYQRGAVFVFDLIGVEEDDHRLIETSRKRIDVMHYDPQRFDATGGWGFATFANGKATERLEQDVVTACFACHARAKNSNYVFSQYRP